MAEMVDPRQTQQESRVRTSIPVPREHRPPSRTTASDTTEAGAMPSDRETLLDMGFEPARVDCQFISSLSWSFDAVMAAGY